MRLERAKIDQIPYFSRSKFFNVYKGNAKSSYQHAEL